MPLQPEHELLQLCLQDLADGKAQLGQLLGKLKSSFKHADLRQRVEVLEEQCGTELNRLKATGFDLEGPHNLWMDGIARDAERDAETVAADWRRDMALVGALRKAYAAQAVSSETALALAQRIGEYSAIKAIARNLSDERATLAELASHLFTLGRDQSLPPSSA